MQKGLAKLNANNLCDNLLIKLYQGKSDDLVRLTSSKRIRDDSVFPPLKKKKSNLHSDNDEDDDDDLVFHSNNAILDTVMLNGIIFNKSIVKHDLEQNSLSQASLNMFINILRLNYKLTQPLELKILFSWESVSIEKFNNLMYNFFIILILVNIISLLVFIIVTIRLFILIGLEPSL